MPNFVLNIAFIQNYSIFPKGEYTSAEGAMIHSLKRYRQRITGREIKRYSEKDKEIQ